MILLPNNVNELNGTVSTPATQVAEVAVKKQSKGGTYVFCAIGNAKKRVPTQMVKKIDNNTVLPGDANIFLRNAILVIFAFYTLLVN